MDDIDLIKQNYILCQEVKKCLARIDRIIAQRDEAIEKLYAQTERLKVDAEFSQMIREWKGGGK